jgi:hypothetical protein
MVCGNVILNILAQRCRKPTPYAFSEPSIYISMENTQGVETTLKDFYPCSCRLIRFVSVISCSISVVGESCKHRWLMCFVTVLLHHLLSRRAWFKKSSWSQPLAEVQYEEVQYDDPGWCDFAKCCLGFNLRKEKELGYEDTVRKLGYEDTVRKLGYIGTMLWDASLYFLYVIIVFKTAVCAP